MEKNNEETTGFKLAMTFKPFINQKCSGHMEIVKDMGRAIEAAIHSPENNGKVFNNGYEKGKAFMKDKYDKLKADNEVLLNALKEITEQFKKVNPLYSNDNEIILKAEEAIKQVESK